MSTTEADEPTATEQPTSTASEPPSPHISWSDSFSQAQTAIQSLSNILPSIPPPVSSSETPCFTLLHNPELASQISTLLRQPDSGSGDNHLCRWLYDTFQTSKSDLQLVVLRFLPIIAGVYLSRIGLRKPLAGFEAVLLAFYTFEMASRNGQAITVNIPDLSHSSIYHETKQPYKNSATDLNLVVISSSLEPQGSVRSTKRARIVGVALELYYSKIAELPLESKIDFCQFCVTWAGQDGEMYKDFPVSNEEEKKEEKEEEKGTHEQEEEEEGAEGEGENKEKEEEKEEKEKEKGEEEEKGIKRKEKREGRIPLPWEILQPMLRILGHCVLGPTKDEGLHEVAWLACRSLYARALHDVNPKAILATGSLLKLVKFNSDSSAQVDHTEIPFTTIINL